MRASGPYRSKTRVRLARQIRQLRHRGLHPKRHLVLGDARQDLGVAELAVIDRVELAQVVERAAPGFGRDARRIRQVQHRVADRAKLDALIRRRQEAASPQPVIQRLVVRVARAPRDQHHERGQVLVLASQPVRDPRPDARPPGKLSPGLEERDRRVVVDRLGVHRADEAKLVGDLGRERQQLRNARAALPVARKCKPARGHRKAVLPRRHARQPLPHPDRVGKVRPLQVARAPAWDRTGPSATVHPTGTGRSPAWRAARNSESPGFRPRPATRPRRRSSALELAIARVQPAQSSPAPRRRGPRSAGE